MTVATVARSPRSHTPPASHASRTKARDRRAQIVIPEPQPPVPGLLHSGPDVLPVSNHNLIPQIGL